MIKIMNKNELTDEETTHCEEKGKNNQLVVKKLTNQNLQVKLKKNQVLKTGVFKMEPFFLGSCFQDYFFGYVITLSFDTHLCVLTITMPRALTSCLTFVLVMVDVCLLLICCVYMLTY